MCVYSMIVDHYTNKWQHTSPALQPWIPMGPPTVVFPSSPIPQSEIDEFHLLLDRAREYDKRMNQPDCELEEKKQKLLKVAEELGIADKINFL